MKLKLALFKNVNYGFVHVEDYNEEHYSNSPDYVQITEFVEVDFKELPKDKVLNKQVENLDKEIEKIKEEAMQKVALLQQKKQELLAITHG